MSFAQKTLRASLVAYLSAMFGSLTFALFKMDFTGYPVGRAGLLILMVTTGVVSFRLMLAMARTQRMRSNWA